MIKSSAFKVFSVQCTLKRKTGGITISEDCTRTPLLGASECQVRWKKVSYGKRANLKEADKRFQHVSTCYLLKDEYYHCLLKWFYNSGIIKMSNH